MSEFCGVSGQQKKQIQSRELCPSRLIASQHQLKAFWYCILSLHHPTCSVAGMQVLKSYTKLDDGTVLQEDIEDVGFVPLVPPKDDRRHRRQSTSPRAPVSAGKDDFGSGAEL